MGEKRLVEYATTEYSLQPVCGGRLEGPLFDGLKARWFVSEVAAELKGQLRTQDLVNDFLSTGVAATAIEKVRTDRDYLFVSGPKMLPYLAACEVLAASMEDRQLPENHRLMALEFLSNRLARADGLTGHIIDGLRLRLQSFKY